MAVLDTRFKGVKEYFKKNDLPKPVSMKYVGPWAYGDIYAVTCGLIRLKKYAVYYMDGEIHTVRNRG